MSESPAPMPPRWNWEERARRAEMLAERLAEALHHEYRRRKWGISAERYHECADSEPALDAWTAHLADLQCLEQAQEAK